MNDHNDIATTYSNLGTNYFLMCDYPSALEKYEKALEIAAKTLRTDHSHIGEYRDYITIAKRHIQYQE
jgi:tetratricopeptide (TPR) repeat protein